MGLLRTPSTPGSSPSAAVALGRDQTAATAISNFMGRISELASRGLMTPEERRGLKTLALRYKRLDPRLEACTAASLSEADQVEALRELLAVQRGSPTLGAERLGVPRCRLFAAKEFKEVADLACAERGANFELGTINWKRFDDEKEGWPNVFIKDVHALSMCDAMFLASLHTPSVVFEQLSVVFSLPRYGLRHLTVVVPFFATGTMERVEHLGEVATAATLARLLSVAPNCACGPVQLVVFDIHALQEQFYFTDNVIIRLKSCVPLLIEKLSQLPRDEPPVCIVFPDDGAFKRFHTKFATRSVVVCHKIRGDGEAREVKIRDGLEFVQDAHCVIVDDLVKSGGTLIECAQVLRAAGAAKISAYVTHGVFPEQSYRKFVHGDEACKIKLDNFWITDTIPTVAQLVRGLEPFRVLSIAPIVASISLYNDAGFD